MSSHCFLLSHHKCYPSFFVSFSWNKIDKMRENENVMMLKCNADSLTMMAMIQCFLFQMCVD